MNPFENPRDTKIEDSLRDSKIPPLSEANRQSFLASAQIHRHKASRWVLPTGFATAASAGLIALFLFIRPISSPAAPTLNDVDKALQMAKTYTVKMSLGVYGRSFSSVTYFRDGDRWRIGQTTAQQHPYNQVIMDSSRTVSILHRGLGGPQVLIEEPRKMPGVLAQIPTPHNFTTIASEIFRFKNKAPIKIERNIRWHGQTVDKFEATSEYLVHGKKVPLTRAVLYADSQTHLPIQLTRTSLAGKSGLVETYSYNFDPIPESTFQPEIPKDVPVTNIPEERQKIRDMLSGRGLAVVDPFVDVAVFLPNTNFGRNFRMKVEGYSMPFPSIHTVYITQGDQSMVNAHWPQKMVFSQPGHKFVTNLAKKTSITVQINGKTYRVPVVSVADIMLEFFGGRY